MHYVLASIILAAEEDGHEPSGTDLLIPETSELIAGIIAFAIIFFVVWKFAVPALNETLAKRQEAEKSRLEAAENAKQEAESLLADYRSQLAEAKEEAARIIDEARQTAESVRSDTVAKAQSEAEEIVSRAREEAGAESQRALEAARQEVANLSVDLAEKVVGGSLDRTAQLNLVEGYLRDLEAGR